MILLTLRHPIADELTERWKHHYSVRPLQPVAPVCSLAFSVRARRLFRSVKFRLSSGLLGAASSRGKALARRERIEGGRLKRTRRLPGCSLSIFDMNANQDWARLPFPRSSRGPIGAPAARWGAGALRYRIARMVRNCPDTGDAGSLVRTLGGVLAVTTMAGEPSTRILADASPLQYVSVSQAIMDHRLRTIRNARGRGGLLRASLIERRLCKDAPRQ